MFSLSDFFTPSAQPTDSSFSASLFDTLSKIAAPAAGVFTAVTSADAAKQAAANQLKLAQTQASTSWTKYIPLAIGAVLVLGVAAFLLKRK
jgi:hypothetical protein